jgi:regulator of replication initiation timing
MIKELVKILVKLGEAKLEKAGIETVILKNQNYFTEARKLWDAIDENTRISKTIEGKLISKIDEFNAAVLKKFPELSQEDIDDLRQAIGGAVNAGKEAVLDNSTIIKQLQESNASLQAENASLKDQLSKVQALIGVVADNSVQETNSNQAATQDNTGNNTVQPIQA